MTNQEIAINAKAMGNEDEALRYIYETIMQKYKNKNEGAGSLVTRLRINNKFEKIVTIYKKM